MNVQSKYPTTPDEFLRWNEGREGKWDLVGGRIVDMMVKVSKNHAILCSNLLALLRTQLAIPRYVVTSADFGVKTANSVRYPDVMVDAELGNGDDLAATAPVLITEVLSPSTMATDFGPKVEEYKTIATLRYYLVLAQEEPRSWLWSRGEGGTWQGPEMTSGVGEVLALPELGVSLPLRQLYAGIADRLDA